MKGTRSAKEEQMKSKPERKSLNVMMPGNGVTKKPAKERLKEVEWKMIGMVFITIALLVPPHAVPLPARRGGQVAICFVKHQN